MHRRLIAAVVAGALLGVPTACQTGSEPSPRAVQSLVQAVPSAILTVGSYATEFRYQVEANDAENTVIGFEGSGIYDVAMGRGSMQYRFDHHSSESDGVISMEAVHDGETILISPDISLSLMDQPLDLRLWIPIPIDDGFSLDLGLNLLKPAVDLEQPFTQVRQHDPTRTLTVLYGVTDDAEVIDRARIKGVKTTHYRATTSLDEALDNWEGTSEDRSVFELTTKGIEDEFGVTSYPVDIWLSDDGLPMRISYRIASPEPGGPIVTFTQDMFDFGKPVNVEVPEPSGSFGEAVADAFQEIMGINSAAAGVDITTSTGPPQR